MLEAGHRLLLQPATTSGPAVCNWVAWAASSWEDCDCDSDVGEHGVPLQPATNALATNDQEVCNWAAVVAASSADCDCHRDAGR